MEKQSIEGFGVKLNMREFFDKQRWIWGPKHGLY